MVARRAGSYLKRGSNPLIAEPTMTSTNEPTRESSKYSKRISVFFEIRNNLFLIASIKIGKIMLGYFFAASRKTVHSVN